MKVLLRWSDMGKRGPTARIPFSALALMAASAAAAGDGGENPWSSTTSNGPVLHLTTKNFESTVFHSGNSLRVTVCRLAVSFSHLLTCTLLIHYRQKWNGDVLSEVSGCKTSQLQSTN